MALRNPVDELPRRHTLNLRCTSTSQSIRMALIFTLMSACNEKDMALVEKNSGKPMLGGLLYRLFEAHALDSCSLRSPMKCFINIKHFDRTHTEFCSIGSPAASCNPLAPRTCARHACSSCRCR
eukprot:1144606-Pelagomonas_calceolata.AAC.4